MEIPWEFTKEFERNQEFSEEGLDRIWKASGANYFQMEKGKI